MKAHVYSGPHYGRLHSIGKRNRYSGLVEVDHRGDKFSVPSCDVECSFCHSCGAPIESGATDCPTCKATDFEN